MTGLIKGFVARLSGALFSGGVRVDGTLGTNGVQRGDAQLEIKNTGGTGHALMSIMQMANPGVTNVEGAVSYGGYNDAGAVRQMGSVSYTWANNASDATGFACLRLEVNTVLGSGESPLRVWGGNRGVGLFTTADTQYGTARYLSINNRDAGKPSIVGGVGAGSTGDLVIDANDGGNPTSVNLQAYNAGDVYLNIGGGRTYVWSQLNLHTAKTPASATAAGTAGDVCFDAFFMYYCVANNTWKRTALASW